MVPMTTVFAVLALGLLFFGGRSQNSQLVSAGSPDLYFLVNQFAYCPRTVMSLFIAIH